MKTFLSKGFGVLVIFAMTFNVALATTPNPEMEICHFPPGNPNNPQTITINSNAWQAHQNHGDYQGVCEGEQNIPVCNVEENLVYNGGFESPVVTAGQGWNVYPNGTVGLGWNVAWNGVFAGAPATANLELHRGVNAWVHDEGMQHAELDTDWINGGSEQASVAISQDVNTISGATYEVSYAFSPRPGTAASENVLEVLVDGVVVATHGPVAGGGNTSWTTYTYEFVANDGTANIAFRDAGTPNTLGTFIDDVKVRCIEDVPEVCDPLYARIRTAERGWWMNWGTGNLGDWNTKGVENPPVYVGGNNLLHNSLGGNGYTSQEWFPLVDEETCEPIVDEEFDFNVPGVAVQRLDGSLRVVLYGSHEGGNIQHLENREFAKGNIELSKDMVNKLTGAWDKSNGWVDPVDTYTRVHDPLINDSENPMDDRGPFNGNIHIHHPSYDNVSVWNDLFRFHLVVTTGNDGFYANYNN